MFAFVLSLCAAMSSVPKSNPLVRPGDHMIFSHASWTAEKNVLSEPKNFDFTLDCLKILFCTFRLP